MTKKEFFSANFGRLFNLMIIEIPKSDQRVCSIDISDTMYYYNYFGLMRSRDKTNLVHIWSLDCKLDSDEYNVEFKLSRDDIDKIEATKLSILLGQL